MISPCSIIRTRKKVNCIRRNVHNIIYFKLNYCNKIYRLMYKNCDSVILFPKHRMTVIFVIIMVGN